MHTLQWLRALDATGFPGPALALEELPLVVVPDQYKERHGETLLLTQGPTGPDSGSSCGCTAALLPPPLLAGGQEQRSSNCRGVCRAYPLWYISTIGTKDVDAQQREQAGSEASAPCCASKQLACSSLGTGHVPPIFLLKYELRSDAVA